MMGVRWRKNYSTSVFFRSMASEKMSNRSKIGSLVAENEYLLARAPKRGVSKVLFRSKCPTRLQNVQNIITFFIHDVLDWTRRAVRPPWGAS